MVAAGATSKSSVTASKSELSSSHSLLTENPFVKQPPHGPKPVPKPVQLESEALQTYQRRLAEKRANLSFAEKVCNVSAEDKLKEEIEQVEELGEVEEAVKENRMDNLQSGEEVAEVTEVKAEVTEEEKMLEVTDKVNENAVWKLPPEQPKSNKNKKGKKKKAGKI